VMIAIFIVITPNSMVLFKLIFIVAVQNQNQRKHLKQNFPKIWSMVFNFETQKKKKIKESFSQPLLNCLH
jgi:hypothetical protein